MLGINALVTKYSFSIGVQDFSSKSLNHFILYIQVKTQTEYYHFKKGTISNI